MAAMTVVADEELLGRLRFSVTRLARLMRQQDETSLTPTLAVLLATIGRAGPLTLGNLAAQEQVAPSTITKLVGRLVADGLVDRLPDPKDGRVCRVALSAAGRRHLETSRSRRTAWLLDRLELLDPADLSRLGAAVDVLEQLAAPGNLGRPA